MASGIYEDFKEDLMGAAVDCTGDTINVALLDDSHAFTATDTSWAAISANEMTGTGYSANGAALASKTITVTSSVAIWDGADTAWTTSTFTAYHAAIYSVTNTSSLICSIDFGGAQTVSGGTFTIEWSTGGIITLT